MAATNQICQLDTITLARAVAAKELSPVELTEAYLRTRYGAHELAPQKLAELRKLLRQIKQPLKQAA